MSPGCFATARSGRLAARLATPFVLVLRKRIEMKYLWDGPVRLRNERLEAAIGAEPRTQLDKASRHLAGDRLPRGIPTPSNRFDRRNNISPADQDAR